MPRTPHIDGHIIYSRIQTLRRFSAVWANRLNGSTFYIKPKFLPWHKETWVMQNNVYLPSNFPDKNEKRQLQDVFKASMLYTEQDMFLAKYGRFAFLWWIASRKIGFMRDALNLRTRQLWTQFIRWHRNRYDKRS